MLRRIKRAIDRSYRTLLIFAHDLLMVPIAWLGSYWFRFNLGQIPQEYWDQGLRTLPWVILVQAGCFYLFGLYKGVWRFASLPDLIRIIKAVAAGTVATMVVLFIVYRLEFIPRSLIVLYPLLLAACCSADPASSIAGPKTAAWRWTAVPGC